MHTIEYVIVKLFYEVLRRIPFRVSLLFAHWCAFLLQYIIRYRRNHVYESLRSVFPEYDNEQLQVTVKDVYYNFSMLWIEILQSWRLNKTFFKNNYKVYNWEAVEEALRKNKGLILLTGHFGNFEWLGYYIASRCKNFYAIMKKVKNPHLNNLIVRTRENLGVRLIYTHGAVKKGLSVIKKGGVIGIVADQDAGTMGIFVNFMGKPSSTARGVALYHIKTGAPLIFCTCLRRHGGKYELFFERIPDALSNELSEDNFYAITQTHTRYLEKWVRKYPGQYFWTHRRWKTQPAADEMESYKNFQELSLKEYFSDNDSVTED